MLTHDQRQILEAVLSSLPKDKNTNEWHEEKARFVNYNDDSVEAYNQALDEVRAIINEFLEPEEQITIKKTGEKA